MKSSNLQHSSPKEIVEGIYPISLPTPFLVGPITVYLIKEQKLTLVDTGPNTKEAKEALNNGLKELGIKINEIEQVFLTHHHSDHSGLISWLRKENPHLQVFAHKIVNRFLTKEENFQKSLTLFYEKLYKEHGVPQLYIEKFQQMRLTLNEYIEDSYIDNELADGEIWRGKYNWQIIYTPGHSYSHISFLRLDDRVLLAGDHLLKGISTNAFIEMLENGERSYSLIDYRRELNKLLNNHFSLILPSHGPSFSDYQEEIEKRLKKQEERAEKIKEIIRVKGEATTFMICQELFPLLYQKEIALTMSDTLGHLDLLEVNNEVNKQIKEGVIYYYLT